jgi:spore coat protein H
MSARGFGMLGMRAVLPWAAVLLSALACSDTDETFTLGEEQAVRPSQPAAPAPAAPAPAAPAPEAPSGPTGPLGPPESIFKRQHVIEVQVELSPEDWEALSFEGMGMRETLFPASGFREVPPYTRFTAKVRVDGVSYENVSIRKKGYIGSLSVIRPSLKLDFERNLEVPLVGGRRRMTLNNDLQDSTHVRQCLSYDLFAAAGLPAPRCNYAHVVVNGVDLGTYSHVEAVDKPMLARYFADDGGNLYEGQLSDFNVETREHLELETNETENDRADVQAVIDALAASDAQVVAALDRVLDLDQFFSFWALETLIGHWDGYASNSNNYFAYHDPTTDKFFFIPWGTDQAFVGDNPNDTIAYDMTVYAAGSIANRLYAVPSERDRYRRRLSELEQQLWQVPDLLARVDASTLLTRDASRADLARLRSHIRTHGDALRAALLLPASDWPEPTPQEPGDACLGSAGALSGTFTTQWGNIDDFNAVATEGTSQFTTSVEIDGALFPGTFQGRAGESAPDIATLRMLAPRPDGLYVLIELNMPIELFTPGYHPFHSFESSGNFGVFHPEFGPFRFAPIGDGAVTLDQASLEPGAVVSGRFDGIINYYVCMATVAQFFTPPPELQPPAGESSGGDDPPVAEDGPVAEDSPATAEPPAGGEPPPAEEPPAGEEPAAEPSASAQTERG